MAKIILETTRLFLREFTKADAPLILQLNNDPNVLKYLHEARIHNEQEALTVLLTVILPQYKNHLGRWAIHIKESNEFIGWCGLKYRADRDEIDLGYRLKKSAWGKGFATETASATLDHGFKKLKIPLITGRAHIENIASLSVLEKIGMQFRKEEIVDDCQVRTYTIVNPYL